MERCPRGRRGRPAKALYGLKPVSRVRIPLSPPTKKRPPRSLFCCVTSRQESSPVRSPTCSAQIPRLQNRHSRPHLRAGKVLHADARERLREVRVGRRHVLERGREDRGMAFRELRLVEHVDLRRSPSNGCKGKRQVSGGQYSYGISPTDVPHSSITARSGRLIEPERLVEHAYRELHVLLVHHDGDLDLG